MTSNTTKNGAQIAAGKALEFCQRRPKWQRMCDIPDLDALILKFSELPNREQQEWKDVYHDLAESAWINFEMRPCRFDFGFVDENGHFWRRGIPWMKNMKNMMMVFMTGGKHGIYRWEPYA